MMLHSIALICALGVFASACLSDRASASDRIALVIDNSVKPGQQASHDVADVSAGLGRLGFVVTQLNGADGNEMRAALGRFAAATPNAEVSVILYSGPGAQIDGTNWLLPADVDVSSPSALQATAISLQSAVVASSKAKTLNLVLLDADRGNPFPKATPPKTGGLIAFDQGFPPRNFVIHYACGPGQTRAAMGAGRSALAAAFALQLNGPRLDVGKMGTLMRREVNEMTGGKQLPWSTTTLPDEPVYLN